MYLNNKLEIIKRLSSIVHKSPFNSYDFAQTYVCLVGVESLNLLEL